MNQRGHSGAAPPPEIRILEFADDVRVKALISVDAWNNSPWFLVFRGKYFHLCSDGIYHELVATLVPESAVVVRGKKTKRSDIRSPKPKGQP